MAIAYDGINYFPVGVNFMEENAMDVIEAKYGIKGSAIVLKLMCKIYKPDLLIEMPADRFGIFEFYRAREIVEAGRLATRAALEQSLVEAG